jgi:hypothetical protein
MYVRICEKKSDAENGTKAIYYLSLFTKKRTVVRWIAKEGIPPTLLAIFSCVNAILSLFFLFSLLFYASASFFFLLLFSFALFIVFFLQLLYIYDRQLKMDTNAIKRTRDRTATDTIRHSINA